jgi:hypothetical protein
MRDALTSAFHALDLLGDLDAGEVFLDGRVRGRLAHEQEVAACGPHGFADRLAGIEIIAEMTGFSRA